VNIIFQHSLERIFQISLKHVFLCCSSHHDLPPPRPSFLLTKCFFRLTNKLCSKDHLAYGRTGSKRPNLQTDPKRLLYQGLHGVQRFHAEGKSLFFTMPRHRFCIARASFFSISQQEAAGLIVVPVGINSMRRTPVSGPKKKLWLQFFEEHIASLWILLFII